MGEMDSFFHPAQRELVERDFNGPVRVAGSGRIRQSMVPLRPISTNPGRLLLSCANYLQVLSLLHSAVFKLELALCAVRHRLV